ncbi:MAG: hypothetical protein EZS28_018866 [Streblomastix strix]|uniref:Uncharacterized protein n=1 Tax=Streblomastix strix TaxID=222440 RepID=A0A5J4VSP8_9EUKA|nr:MAG: hypothetical protein EZS28_018866 [Streblomastix strix]
MIRLIQIGYAAFWNNQLGEISDDTNYDGNEIFTIPTEKAINEAKLRRDEKRAREQRQYESDMAKIKARKKPIFSEGKTVESARLVPNEDSVIIWLDNCNGQEHDQPNADSGALRQVVKYKNKDTGNDNILKDKSTEATKVSEEISQEKETRNNMRLNINNWRDPIHNSTNLNEARFKLSSVKSCKTRIQQVDAGTIGLNSIGARYQTQLGGSTSQLIINHCASRNLTNGQRSRQMLRAHVGRNVDQRESGEGIRTRRVEDQQPQEFESTRSNNSSENIFGFLSQLIQQLPIGIRLLTGNTVTMFCLNNSKESITIAPLMRRQCNQEISLLEETQVALDLDHYRYISNTRDTTMHEILQYIHRQVCSQAKYVQSRMVQGSYLASLTNLSTTENYQEGQKREGLISSLDSARLAQSDVVHKAERDCNAEDMLRREYASLTNGSKTQKQRLGAAFRIDLPFCFENKDGEKLFRQLLQARRLNSNAVVRVISNWSSQRRIHISGLTLLAGYLKRIHKQPENLLDLEQAQIPIANYFEDAINQKCSDISVKNQRCALDVLFKFMGYSEQQIQFDIVKQLMRKFRMRLRKSNKEKQI